MQRFEIKSKNFFSILSTIYYLLSAFLIGCATVEYPSPAAKAAPAAVFESTRSFPGIYHRVEKGQTLWRISKMYGVGLDEIIGSNRINDLTRVNAGQLLFIPGGQRQVLSSGVSGEGRQDFIWPSKGKILSGFGDKAGNTVNRGITLRAVSNAAAVVASASGTVIFATEKLKGYGQTVIIAHEGGLMTIYAMLSQILVKPGERINQGEPIARCAHGLMHFEIRKGHIPQNPYHYLAS